MLISAYRMIFFIFSSAQAIITSQRAASNVTAFKLPPELV